MNIVNHYDNTLSLKEKVLYMLSILKKATADEVAMEIMELQGTSTEEGVAELNVAVREALKELQHEGLLKMQTEKDKQIRYFLKAD